MGNIKTRKSVAAGIIATLMIAPCASVWAAEVPDGVDYYSNIRLVKPYVDGFDGRDPLDNLRVKKLYIIGH